jgi:hypothetical protein
MGFSGSAPVQQKPAAVPAAPVAAPTVAAQDDDVVAVIAAALAAYDSGGEAVPVIGRLPVARWWNYARAATVTVRDQMF